MRRSSSLSRVQELQMQHRLESRSVSISSVDELQSVLSDNNEPLFIDIPKRENIEIIFPPNSTHITPTHVASKVSFGKANGKLHSYEALRNSSPRRTRSATPVVYRSNSAASLYREQQKVPLFVPSQILMSPHHHHHSSYSEDPFDGFDGPAFELEPEHPKPAHYVPPTDETTAGRYGSDFSPTDDLPNDLPDDLTDELPGDTKAKGKESKPKKSKARKVKAACRKGWDKIRRLVRKMF
ncbi:MAG: hypothetical protein M1819_005935 [Sarea resinae]|nr:MAG: hypothetical protein M1819_005935 [Sarea resinae]